MEKPGFRNPTSSAFRRAIKISLGLIPKPMDYNWYINTFSFASNETKTPCDKCYLEPRRVRNKTEKF